MNVRTISIFAAILCTAALFGCAKPKETEPREQTPESAPVTSVPEEEESEEGTEVDLSGLSDERFDGYTYRIIVRKGRESTQYYDEQQDDVVADAIYRRNKAVEEKYGIKPIINYVGPAVAAHSGKGTLSIFYVGESR